MIKFFTLPTIALLSSVFIFPALAETSGVELTETTNLVMAGNKYVTLLGNQIKLGEQAPDFKVVTDSFSPVTLAEFKNKSVLISDNIRVLSDAVWRDFGHNYGLLIKDMGLLTRAIIIIDSDGKIAYKELVANISQHPDYETALTKLKSMSLAVKPSEVMTSERSE